MMTKQISHFLIILTSLIFSCSENKKTDIIPQNKTEEFSDKIILYNLEANLDTSQITIKWSKLTNPAFAYYDIYSTEQKGIIYTKGNSNFNFIGRIENASETSITNKNLPYSPYLRYVVVGVLNNSDKTLVISDYKEININSRHILVNKPYDIFHIPNQNQFVILSKSDTSLALYDYNTKLIKQIKLPYDYFTQNYPIYGSTGIYNGNSEIYLPALGKIMIYNAKDLSLIGQVPVKSYQNYSTTYFDNKIFVSGQSPMFSVIDRNSKKAIEQSTLGDIYNFRLLSSKNKFSNFINVFAISTNIIPVELGASYYNKDGMFLSFRTDSYHGDYSLNPMLFKIAPDGESFVTDYRGAVYDYNLKFLKYLDSTNPNNNQFVDFEYDDEASLLYCAMLRSKSLSVFDKNYNFVKSIPLDYYPVKIYKVTKSELIVAVDENASNQVYGTQFLLENAKKIWFVRLKL